MRRFGSPIRRPSRLHFVQRIDQGMNRIEQMVALCAFDRTKAGRINNLLHFVRRFGR